MKQLGLLIRLIIGIIAGILIGMCGRWFGIADTDVLRYHHPPAGNLYLAVLNLPVIHDPADHPVVHHGRHGRAWQEGQPSVRSDPAAGLRYNDVISGLLTFFIGKAVPAGDLFKPITGDVLESNAFEPLFTIDR